MVVRWHFMNTMPILFDILSIGAILVMHHMNFKERSNKTDTLYGDEIYELMPEDVETLDHLLPSD